MPARPCRRCPWASSRRPSPSGWLPSRSWACAPALRVRAAGAEPPGRRGLPSASSWERPTSRIGPPLFGFLCAGLVLASFGPHPLPVILVQIAASSLISGRDRAHRRRVGLDRRLRWVAAAPAVLHPRPGRLRGPQAPPAVVRRALLALTVLAVLRLAPGAAVRRLSDGRASSWAWRPSRARPWRRSPCPQPRFGSPGSCRRSGRASLLAGVARVRLGAAALVVLPWTLRNYVVLPDSCFITTDRPRSSGAGTTRSQRAPRSSCNGRAGIRGRPGGVPARDPHSRRAEARPTCSARRPGLHA